MYNYASVSGPVLEYYSCVRAPVKVPSRATHSLIGHIFIVACLAIPSPITLQYHTKAYQAKLELLQRCVMYYIKDIHIIVSLIVHIFIVGCQAHTWHPILSNALHRQFNFNQRDGLIETLFFHSFQLSFNSFCSASDFKL